MAYTSTPSTYVASKGVLDKERQETAASTGQFVGSLKYPDAPRFLKAVGGPLQVVLSWTPPVKFSNVAGYNIYQGTESVRIATISSSTTLQYAAQVPSAGVYAFYISCVNNSGKESAKIQVKGTAT